MDQRLVRSGLYANCPLPPVTGWVDPMAIVIGRIRSNEKFQCSDQISNPRPSNFVFGTHYKSLHTVMHENSTPLGASLSVPQSGSWVLLPARARHCPLLYSIRLEPPLQWITWSFHMEVKHHNRKADHSTPTSAEVKNGGVIASLPHTSSWCGTISHPS
jgi:hypothetical protein